MKHEADNTVKAFKADSLERRDESANLTGFSPTKERTLRRLPGTKMELPLTS